MHSMCPSVSATRWASLDRAVNWFCVHREELEAYVENKDTKVAPNDVWWVSIEAVKDFMRVVDKFF